MSVSPFEILIARFEVFIAPVGEAFPVIDITPAGNWVKIGTNGARNQGEEGVTITHEQAMEPIRVYGATGPVKMVRTTEDLRIGFTLLDLTLEEYTRILNNVTVVDNAEASGIAGFREIDSKFGLDPLERALLVKAGQSPYGDTFSSQYEIPKVVQSASPAVVFVKNAGPMLTFEFMAVEDPAASSDAKRFGRLVFQDATAL